MSNISSPGTGNLDLMQKIEELENQNEELQNIISNFGTDFVKIDLNNVMYMAFGYCSNCINTPYERNGFLEVIQNGVRNTILQRYTPYNSADTYMRFHNKGTWTDWVKN